MTKLAGTRRSSNEMKSLRSVDDTKVGPYFCVAIRYSIKNDNPIRQRSSITQHDDMNRYSVNGAKSWEIGWISLVACMA